MYETLKREMLDLKLEPGRMLSENEICERFGVSRTPVREAMRLLQEQGFVENVPYKGIRVTLLSLDNIKQMIYMRLAVETNRYTYSFWKPRPPWLWRTSAMPSPSSGR